MGTPTGTCVHPATWNNNPSGVCASAESYYDAATGSCKNPNGSSGAFDPVIWPEVCNGATAVTTEGMLQCENYLASNGAGPCTPGGGECSGANMCYSNPYYGPDPNSSDGNDTDPNSSESSRGQYECTDV